MTAGHEERAGPALAPAPLVYGAFALGLTIANAFRVLIILQHFAPGWGRPVWSFVVVGSLAFLYCRYRIAGKRRRAVDEHGPIVRIGPDNGFSPIEREALAYPPVHQTVAGEPHLPDHLGILDHYDHDRPGAGAVVLRYSLHLLPPRTPDVNIRGQAARA